MSVLRIAAWVALALSIAWMTYDPGFEPAISIVCSVLALGGLMLSAQTGNGGKGLVQNQKASDEALAIQAGRDISIASKDSSTK